MCPDPVRCANTSGLLRNKSHGGRIKMQKSQLASWVFPSAQAFTNTYIDENVIDIPYQSANVSGCDAEINTTQN
jgi:hypothetical protein